MCYNNYLILYYTLTPTLTIQQTYQQMTAIGMSKSFNYITFSATANQVPEQTSADKLDNIISKLEDRKKQLIEILETSITKFKRKENCSISIDQQECNNVNSVLNELSERKIKYENKISLQIKQKEKLNKLTKQAEQKIFKYVVDLQNSEIELKQLSQTLSIKFKKAFALNYQGSQNSKKWLNHKILQLQSQIQLQELKMKNILIKFYIEQQGFKDHNCSPTLEPLLQYIIKMRWVNKLYSFLIQNKNYRTEAVQKKNYENQFQFQDQSNSSESSNEQQKLDSKNDHDTWLKILKLMKILQKLQPIPITIQEKIQIQTETNQINIKQFQQQIKAMIQKSVKIKKQNKVVKIKMDQYKKDKQEIQQQINIKKQLIQSYIAKVNKIQKQINQQKYKIQQSKNMRINNENLLSQANQKQLKEVQQAIRYFNSKKLCKQKLNYERNMTSNKKLRTLGDLSTQFMSPHKSFISQNRLISPDLAQTKQNNKKYSLKNLLSPPKPPINGTDKKKAWK